MKNVVLLDDLKESDIRPEKIYNQYKELLSQDARKYFSNASLLVEVNCPGCSANDISRTFAKGALNYQVCARCGSYFVSPRPCNAALEEFYKNSSAVAFLRKALLGNTQEARKENIFSHRVHWITGLVEEYNLEARAFLDFRSRAPAFLEELGKTGIFSSFFLLKPEYDVSDGLLLSGVKAETCSGIPDSCVDVFAAFETVEREFNPQDLFRCAFKACRKNGLFIITSVASSGFEYQALKEHSPNIIIPDRMNILSLEALISRIEDAGFTVIEASTPGRLDVEIVKKTYQENPAALEDSFWKYVFDRRDEDALHFFQEYLQQFRLSSHVRIAAIKK